MNRKLRQRQVPDSVLTQRGTRGWWLGLHWGAVLATLLWFVSATSLASRVHLVMGYATVPAGPASLELFLAGYTAWLFTTIVAVVWLVLVFRLLRRATRVNWGELQVIVSWGGAAAAPLLAKLLQTSDVEFSPNYWEPLWLSAGSGLSCGLLASQWSRSGIEKVEGRWGGLTVVACTSVAMGLWWYLQSADYYANYLLGFNDFAHFAQRVANTAAGRGLLLESPVLPTYWDHFNPGLLALVPLWQVFPSVQLFFALQAVALASGGVLLWGLARQLKFDQLGAAGFGLAWLLQPVLGQMNLAYTYGWHPISLAIPLMLAALWSLIAQRPWWAAALAVCAMSLEEGVIVVVALFCAGCAAQVIFNRAIFNRARPADGHRPATARVLGGTVFVWTAAATVTALAFVLVYRYSGIAEFQTGRFVALGNSAGEVLLSPILRPAAFWGAIFRWDKLAFCLSLWLPCFVPSLIRGWRWLLPTALPLLVLIVWDHKPATSLAFQYSSTLLPLFWLAALYGSRSTMRLSSAAACGTGLILGLFVGQMPYSSPTLLDVIGHTYHIDDYDANPPWRRHATDPDGQWLTEQVAQIRSEGGEVLATGRIAAHVVGNRDVETVGQYLERRDRLAKLPDRLGNPIGHYRWIVLDRREGFQQSLAQTAAVEREALQAGFHIIAEEYDIVVMVPGAR